MYAPIYVLPKLLLQRDRVLANPVRTALGTARDITHSGMMLATYIIAMKATLCAFRHGQQHKAGPLSPWIALVGGLLSGTAVLWEPPHRRQELAIYVRPAARVPRRDLGTRSGPAQVLPQALTVVWNVLRRRGWVKAIPGGDTLLFATAMACGPARPPF